MTHDIQDLSLFLTLVRNRFITFTVHYKPLDTTNWRSKFEVRKIEGQGHT